MKPGHARVAEVAAGVPVAAGPVEAVVTGEAVEGVGVEAAVAVVPIDKGPPGEKKHLLIHIEFTTRLARTFRTLSERDSELHSGQARMVLATVDTSVQQPGG